MRIKDLAIDQRNITVNSKCSKPILLNSTYHDFRCPRCGGFVYTYKHMLCDNDLKCIICSWTPPLICKQITREIPLFSITSVYKGVPHQKRKVQKWKELR